MEQAILEKKVRVIPATKPQKGGRSAVDGHKRVAAYCRVSTDSDEQITSYKAQKAYYTQKIEETPDWELAGVFADEGISGTSLKKRTEFKRMIAACKRGRIDLILTKSLSRFARNTVDCLDTVRMLKALGIGVIFEKENINTLTESSEFLITLFSGFAQAESESLSKNVSWGVQKSREAGNVPFQYSKLLGYKRGADGQPEIVPAEAETVKRIYRLYLDGCSERKIQQILEEEQAPTATGVKGWSHQVIHNILINERYIGDALLQKTYITDCISKRVKKNQGERPMVYVENNHPAIIPRAMFFQVKEEMARRTSKRKVIQKSAKTEMGKYSSKYALSELLVCGECGTPYRRCTWARNGKKRIVWRCISRLEFGKKYCHNSPTLDENRLHAAILAAMNDVSQAKQEINGTIKNIAAQVYRHDGKDGVNLLELQERLAVITTQQGELLEIILEDMDNPELNAKLKDLAEEKLNLQEQISACQSDQQKQENLASRLADLEEFLQAHPGHFVEFENTIVYKLIDKITVVNDETIRIRFRGQELEYEQNL